MGYESLAYRFSLDYVPDKRLDACLFTLLCAGVDS